MSSQSSENKLERFVREFVVPNFKEIDEKKGLGAFKMVLFPRNSSISEVPIHCKVYVVARRSPLYLDEKVPKYASQELWDFPRGPIRYDIDGYKILYTFSSGVIYQDEITRWEFILVT